MTEIGHKQLLRQAKCRFIFGTGFFVAGVAFAGVTAVGGVALIILFGPVIAHIPVIVLVAVSIGTVTTGTSATVSMVTSFFFYNAAWKKQKNLIQYYQHHHSNKQITDDDFPAVKTNLTNPFDM